VSLRQKSRDAIVRIIKYQLDSYLRTANADFDMSAQDYNFNFTENVKTADVNDLFKIKDESLTELDVENEAEEGFTSKRNLMDAETRRVFRYNYDLNCLAEKLDNNEQIARVNLDLSDHVAL
jgi:hypothetical protein